MVIDQQIILVSPLRVLFRLWELIPTPDFWGSIVYSLARITAGFLLGVAAGTVLAALSARVRRGAAADPQLMEMARVFRIPAGRSIRYVYLPQVMPYFLSACGSALGLCWKSGIAAEVIGMPEGSIGEQLQQAKVYLDTPDLFAWTLVIVLVSLAFERAFLALLRRGAKAMERM